MAQVQNIVDSKLWPDDGNSFRTLFCKESVYVHPSGTRDDGIPGYVSLIEMDGKAAFAWTPYYMLRGDESSFVNIASLDPDLHQRLSQDVEASQINVPPPACTTDLYAVRVPLSEVQSIRKMSSGIGVPHITVVLTGGIALPPYYFHTGGIREFLNSIEEYATLIKSNEDVNLFFVHDLSHPLAQSLSSAKLLHKKEILENSSIHNNNGDNTNSNNNLSINTQENRQLPLTQPPQEISWSILENFAKITRYARLAEKTLFADGLRSPPPPPSSIPRVSHASPHIPAPALASPGSHERPSFPHATSIGSFEVLGSSVEESNLPPKPVERGHILTQEDWIASFDNEGRLSPDVARELRKRIFYGGIEPELRREAWKYLLGYYEFNSTFAEREQMRREKSSEYLSIKSQWASIGPEQERYFSKYRSRKHRIEKDVVRTDRTHPYFAEDGGLGLQLLQSILLSYAFFNFDLGYVQGMSDLLAPILVNMQDEVDAYWCFKKLMDRIGGNFHKDQNGMHTQLVQLANLVKCMDPELYEYLKGRSCTNMFFCFRWVLIQFKREFAFDTIMGLWEMLWSNYCGKNYHLFICLAILMKKRTDILSENMEFDDILKYINNMSMHMNPQEFLVYAELLYNNFLKKTDPQFDELRTFILG